MSALSLKTPSVLGPVEDKSSVSPTSLLNQKQGVSTIGSEVRINGRSEHAQIPQPTESIGELLAAGDPVGTLLSGKRVQPPHRTLDQTVLGEQGPPSVTAGVSGVGGVGGIPPIWPIQPMQPLTPDGYRSPPQPHPRPIYTTPPEVEWGALDGSTLRPISARPLAAQTAEEVVHSAPSWIRTFGRRLLQSVDDVLPRLGDFGRSALRGLGRLLGPIVLAGQGVYEAVSDPNPMRGVAAGAGVVIGGYGGWLGGAWCGAQLGGLLGSVVPGVGTVVGAAVGGVVGGVVGAIAGSELGKIAGRGLHAATDTIGDAIHTVSQGVTKAASAVGRWIRSLW